MQRDQEAYVLDMLIATSKAVSYAEGRSFEAFVEDRRTPLAIVKSIKIV